MKNAQKVFSDVIASAKTAGDVGAEAEAEAFSGNIAYQQGPMDLGEKLTAHALELSKKPGVSRQFVPGAQFTMPGTARTMIS